MIITIENTTNNISYEEFQLIISNQLKALSVNAASMKITFKVCNIMPLFDDITSNIAKIEIDTSLNTITVFVINQ